MSTEAALSRKEVGLGLCMGIPIIVRLWCHVRLVLTLDALSMRVMRSLGLRAGATPCMRRVGQVWSLRRNGVVALGHSFAFKDVRRERRERILVVNAADKNDDAAFAKGEYVEAVIDHGTQNPHTQTHMSL